MFSRVGQLLKDFEESYDIKAKINEAVILLYEIADLETAAYDKLSGLIPST